MKKSSKKSEGKHKPKLSVLKECEEEVIISLKKLKVTDEDSRSRLQSEAKIPLGVSIKDDDVWSIVRSFFDAFGLVQAQIDSYNRLVERSIPDLIMRTKCEIKIKSDEESPPKLLKTISFSNVKFDCPRNADDSTRIVPIWCSYRDMTYESTIAVDIIETTADGVSTVIPNVIIGSIPVMVKSCLCNLTKMTKTQIYESGEDPSLPGGYFVIKGSEKTIVAQERQANNRVYVFENRNTHPHYDVFTEVRSNPYGTTHTTLTQIGLFLNKEETIGAILPYLNNTQPVPLTYLFAALGVTDKKLIASMCCPCPEAMDFLRPSLEVVADISQDDAVRFIGTCGKRFAEDEDSDDVTVRAEAWSERILVQELFHHIHASRSVKIKEETFRKNTLLRKAFFLGYMVRRLLTAAVIRKANATAPLEDRDHFTNKRLHTTGSMLLTQFQTGFQRLIKGLRTDAQKKPTQSCDALIQSRTLSLAMANAIGSNKWGIRGSTKMAGVSQMYERHNYLGAIGNLRKLTTPVGEGGRIVIPRQLHPSHLGIIDPTDTPEGKMVGLSKVLAMGCIVTVGSSPDAIRTIIAEEADDLVDMTSKTDPTLESVAGAFSKCKILLNGDWFATTTKPRDIVDTLRHLRRTGSISYETSVSFDTTNNEIRVWTDAGRLMRPMMIVEGGELVCEPTDISLPFRKLLSKGVIEFLDKDEEDFGTLMCTVPSELETLPKYKAAKITHCDIHPSLMFGAASACTPFPDHNQAPRNTYQAGMAKQSLGMPRLNIHANYGNDVMMTYYPQKPLVKSRLSEAMRINELPMGINAIVAIVPYLGFGEEDSVILNKASVDRGMFDGSKIINYKCQIRQSAREELGDPAVYAGKCRGKIDKLDDDGIVIPGSVVRQNDVLVLKIVRDESVTKSYKEMPLMYEEPWPAVIRSVMVSTNIDGYKCIRIQAEQRRRPVVGDKMAARCAQKGTIGAIVPSCDLPFTPDGLVPDIVFNPLGHPKRMTIAYFLEMICGKTVATDSNLHKVKLEDLLLSDGVTRGGKFSKASSFFHPAMDATPFRPFELDSIREELRQHGFDNCGDTKMISGLTGEELECLVYMGPIYYQRLKHCAIDKIHARATGPITAISHQPTAGREYDGGLRSGEMERDNFAANGAPGIVRDRLMEQSDKFEVTVCANCGVQALVEEFSSTTGLKMCRLCNGTELKVLNVPYGSKLMMHELAAMGIVFRLS